MQMLQDAAISEVHKICDVLHFLEIREWTGFFFKHVQPLYMVRQKVIPWTSDIWLISQQRIWIFYKKIYTAILQPHLHIIAKLYYIVTPFDKVMLFEQRKPHVL